MVLAHSAQRRHVSPDSASASPYQLHTFLDTVDTSTCPATITLPTLDLFDADLSIDNDIYLDSRQSTPYEPSSLPSSTTDTQFMTDNPSQNPRLRVQQSTPNSTGLPYSPPPMSAGSQQPQTWNTFQDWSHLSPHIQQQYPQPVLSAHKRLSSESSVGSAGPASPYTQPAVFPHIVDTETQSVNSPHFESFDNSYSSAAQFTKPLPAYTNPLSNGTLFHQAYNLQPSTNNADQYTVHQSAMRQAMRGQRGNGMSGRQSLSTEQSYGGGEYDSSAEMRNAPNLDRSLSEAYQDELYNPSMQQVQPSSQPSQPQPSQGNLLSPSYRQTFNDRLRAADAARSASPTSSMTRERSPFREDSEYASQNFAQDPNSPARISSARQIREAQKLQDDAQAYQDHHPQISSHDFASPNTISPKEVSLDYHEPEDDSKNFPLFPQQAPQVKQENGFSSLNTRRSQNSNEQYNTARSGPSSYPSSTPTQQANSQFTFMPPSVPGTNVPNTYPFISHSRRQSSSIRSHNSDQVPDFPTTLSSMESTKSDSTPGEIIRPAGFASQSLSQSEPSSQEAQTTLSSSPLPRPHDTSANAGTYTCTAPSCTARFDSSAKLHKHRRDSHPSLASTTVRSSASPYAGPTSPATPSLTTNSQAAANNVSRNNQPGPHKCEKINPSTGKPCNTIFSRSYDLTRHEDTIHNNRKHKVRCHLCTDEKTFSRNDALTRHMRVVHPEVDMGGKGRRGGRA